jgi:hypothetical protein
MVKKLTVSLTISDKVSFALCGFHSKRFAAAAAACILIAAAVAPLQQPRFNARAITFSFEIAGFSIMLKSVVFANRRLSSVRAHGIATSLPRICRGLIFPSRCLVRCVSNDSAVHREDQQQRCLVRRCVHASAYFVILMYIQSQINLCTQRARLDA